MSSLNGQGREVKAAPGQQRAGFAGDVSPYAATCGREVVETGWDLGALLRSLAALASTGERSDFAVWEDERLVALVFDTGTLLVFQRVRQGAKESVGAAPEPPKDAAEPTRDTLHPEGL
jgi:hypothetical protein